MYKYILYTKQDSVATITFNSPETRNAFVIPMREELVQALDDAEKDKEVRVVILTGAGDKAFVSGANMKEFLTMTPDDMMQRAYTLGSLGMFKKVEDFEKPIIAAINGFCLGAGSELTMCCDLRIAAESAKFGQPEANLGIIPGCGGTQRLVRLVGMTKAKELCFIGEPIDAKEAERLGLVNKVVPLAQLMETAMAMAKKIAAKSPLTIKILKRSMNLSWQSPLDVGLAYESLAMASTLCTQDVQEGINSFFEKRPATFKGK